MDDVHAIFIIERIHTGDEKGSRHKIERHMLEDVRESTDDSYMSSLFLLPSSFPPLPSSSSPSSFPSSSFLPP